MHGAASCVSRDQQTPQVGAINYSTVEMLTTRDSPAVIDAKAIHWSRIAIFACPTCIRRPPQGTSYRNIAIRFGMEKLDTRLVWLAIPDGEKKFEDMITRIDTIHECDKQ